ncbi:hypothetical protein EDD11_001532 [Mortierella claussenii]|nr:hypothetical protein EDD11_001532 [Mortierella claussenii]
MKFQKVPRSYTHAFLSWFLLVIIYIMLVYYAYSKIMEVAAREYFTQTTATDVTPKKPIVAFPDILICTQGERVQRGTYDDPSITFSDYDISKFSSKVTPCDDGDTSLSIVSVDNFQIDSKKYVYVDMSIELEADSFAKNGGILGTDDDFPYDLDTNAFLIGSKGWTVDIRVVPTEVQAIKEGFLGLFGMHESQQEYRLSSSLSIAPTDGATVIRVFVPTVYYKEKQVLTTSIPSAFSAWGGASSAAWGIFYFLFGRGRSDPFGFLARFFRQQTQHHLTAKYGYWASDSAPSKPAAVQMSLSQTSLPNDEKTERVIVPAPSPVIPCTIEVDHSHDAALILQQLKQQQEVMDKQEQHINKVEDNFNKLDGLLREYYLEMGLASSEDLLTSESAEPWHKRMLSRKVDLYGDKNEKGDSLPTSREK